MKRLALLGSTGSIGAQSLEVVRAAPGSFSVEALVAARSWERLRDQALEFRPRVVALADPEAARRLAAELPPEIAVRGGPEAAEELAAELDYDLLVNGLVGAAGVRPSHAALARGLDLALANKESLVVAGAPLMELARSRGARVIPVDSEHAALQQCLHGEDLARVRQVWITASGGPFRDRTPAELAGVTVDEALRHPNWDMGRRITIGSATLLNKAFEVVEAHHLFGLEPERIGVVIHRQSLVHSLVEFVDGSVLAQMGPPDMRLTIHWALHFPERAPFAQRGFEPALFSRLDFQEVDAELFPGLELGFECVRAGEDAGAALNAADEVAVEAFLDGRIPFQEIVRVDRRVLESRPGLSQGIDELLASDARCRELASAEVQRRTATPTLP